MATVICSGAAKERKKADRRGGRGRGVENYDDRANSRRRRQAKKMAMASLQAQAG